MKGTESKFQLDGLGHLKNSEGFFVEKEPFYIPLGGGFKYFLFSSLPGEMIQFD